MSRQEFRVPSAVLHGPGLDEVAALIFLHCCVLGPGWSLQVLLCEFSCSRDSYIIYPVLLVLTATYAVITGSEEADDRLQVQSSAEHCPCERTV